MLEYVMLENIPLQLLIPCRVSFFVAKVTYIFQRMLLIFLLFVCVHLELRSRSLLNVEKGILNSSRGTLTVSLQRQLLAQRDLMSVQILESLIFSTITGLSRRSSCSAKYSPVAINRHSTVCCSVQLLIQRDKKGNANNFLSSTLYTLSGISILKYYRCQYHENVGPYDLNPQNVE